MRHLKIGFGVLVALTALLACAGCSGGSGNVARIGFVSGDITADGLTLGKGGGTLIGVEAYDKDGNVVNVSAASFEWKSDNGKALAVKTLGTAALVSGEIDWFDTVPPTHPDGGTDGGMDAGTPAIQTVTQGGGDGGTPDAGAPYEPHANLTVSYDGNDPPLAISVPVAIVINVSGTWHVVIAGITEQDLQLDQQGRSISYKGTNVAASGSINGNQITLEQQGFTLKGAFTTPTDASGTFTGPATGNWTAHKTN